MKQIKFILAVVFVMIFISCSTTKQSVSSYPFYNSKNKKVVKKKKATNQLVWYQKPTQKDTRKQNNRIEKRKKGYMIWYNAPEKIHSRDPFYDNN